jgi:hypothetical protein
MVLLVDPDLCSVGGDEVGGNQIVDGQPVFSHQVTDPTAQGDPADPY